MTANLKLGHQELSVQATLKRIKTLQNNRQERKKQNRFFSEGVRNFVHIVDNHFEIDTILFSKKLCTSALARKFVRQKRREGVTTLNLPPEDFRSFSTAERASGIATIVKPRYKTLEQLDTKKSTFWVVVDQIRSAGNMGTLIRSSDAFGGSGFILLGDSIDVYSPTVIRASMGSLFRQQFIKTDFKTFKAQANKLPFMIIGASPQGSICFDELEYSKASFLFLGEERKGLSQEQEALCNHLIRIPMHGQADSLNVGVAGGLIMYELSKMIRP